MPNDVMNVSEPLVSHNVRDGGASVVNLETFVIVAKCGGLTAGAEKLGVSRAAVSIAVKRLEEALGMKLFDEGRPKRLTAQGEELYAQAEPLVRDLLQLLERPCPLLSKAAATSD